MDDDQAADPQRAEHHWVDITVRLILAAVIVYWSFLLLRPFIAILIWAAILSVAMHPIYLWLRDALGERPTLASFLLTFVSFLVILVPVSAIGIALVDNLSELATRISEGSITVPPPPAYVAEWPFVGEKVSAFWQEASEGLGEILITIEPQLKDAARKLLAVVGNIGFAVLQFTVAIIIAGFTHSRAAGIQGSFLKTFAARAAPRAGAGFVDLAGGTVRSVARGVVGISLIQSILFGVGALVAAIPLAGLLTFIVLILAIIQVGPGLVIIPVIIFAWSTMDTLVAVVLTAYLVPVMLLDNVLKPIVMGRGLPVPMLVIFIGVIGGTIRTRADRCLRRTDHPCPGLRVGQGLDRDWQGAGGVLIASPKNGHPAYSFGRFIGWIILGNPPEIQPDMLERAPRFARP